eukprot:CAMPEP_0118946442 /NCGR_PEP_ID=MMETSP1169-20130426/44204_1 /TAXON_ID=36882 /ORGANISM="Pyramimonas obovata, Strain CCMP722" /LENGTH=183 /DNA_ID=CAMNT_0006892411 /DNA_START=186 /DNA_END=733 /DNA_ORIENTATION=+
MSQEELGSPHQGEMERNVTEGSHSICVGDATNTRTEESETKVEVVEVSLERLVALVQQLVALLDTSQDGEMQADGKRSIDLQIAAKLLSSLIRGNYDETAGVSTSKAVTDLLALLNATMQQAGTMYNKMLENSPSIDTLEPASQVVKMQEEHWSARSSALMKEAGNSKTGVALIAVKERLAKR